MHPGLIWKAEYNYYGYGEGGRSGAQYCNDNPTLAIGATIAPVVPCSSVAEYRDVPGHAGLRVHRATELPRQ